MKLEKSSKAYRRIVYLIIIILIFSLMSVNIYYFYYNQNTITDTKSYLNKIYKIERGFIENIPIYEDFATPLKEKKLRKFLLNAHLEVARNHGINPIPDDREITKLADSGKLVKIESGPEKLYYFYNVRKKYRFLTHKTYAGLVKITERFQKNINSRKKLPPVKIAISSALRPASYQRNLLQKNFNATIVSTHSYGVSFDIFFDDYFLVLPPPDYSNRISGTVLDLLRTRSGFILGDSLRRQFRTILMETLIQLQDEGILYAILEKRQRCYHVTILKK